MDLIAKIISLLEAKFQGARKDVLQTMAGVIALQATDEESANGIVDHLTADAVQKFGQSYRSRIDSEIQQSNTSFEQNLRKKYDFREKQQQQGGGDGHEGGNQGGNQGGALTIDQIRQLMQETMAPITQRMDAFEQQRAVNTRRSSFEELLKGEKLSPSAQEMLLGNFDRMTFKDEAEYEAYLTATKPMIQKMAQDYTDAQMRQDPLPAFANKDKEGVSQAVADYLKAGAETQTGLGGKAV